MRVLHVTAGISRNLGGVPTVVLELSKEQAANGSDVWVVSTNVDSPTGTIDVPVDTAFQSDGVSFRCFEADYRPLLYSAALKRFIDREIESFDIVHVHGLYRFPMTYAARTARRRGLPYVCQLHGQLDPYLWSKSSRSVWLKRVYERCFEMPNLNGAGCILYTADEERDKTAFLGLQAPARVIPNGIDWKRYRNLPRRGALRARWQLERNEIVLFLGRLHHKKGLDRLIPAFDRVREARPEARLVIAGPDGDDYSSIVRGWVRTHGFESHVQFAGMLHGADVPQAYVDADVFVLPSYSENFGLTVVEAMACQLPVVISDQINIHAAVQDSGSGLVVACDEEAIAEALIGLLADEQLRMKMGVAGRQAARQRFAWSSIVGRIDNLYSQLTAKTTSCGES